MREIMKISYLLVTKLTWKNEYVVMYIYDSIHMVLYLDWNNAVFIFV